MVSKRKIYRIGVIGGSYVIFHPRMDLGLYSLRDGACITFCDGWKLERFLRLDNCIACFYRIDNNTFWSVIVGKEGGT